MSFTVFDDRHRELSFFSAPKRVVSLVPSDTLTLAALGCGGALVGRTDYCQLPEALVAGIPTIGGTKNPRVADIVDLNPDLILANQEENSRSDLEALAQQGFRVFIAFPKRVADGLAHMARLARIFHVASDPAVRSRMKQGYDALRRAEAARKETIPLRGFCPIWAKPLMTIHGSTYISDMLDLVGIQNVFADRERRYPLAADLAFGRAQAATPSPNPFAGANGRAPEIVAPAVLLDGTTEGRDVRYPRIAEEELLARAPEIFVLPSEPHPFSEEDANGFRAIAAATEATTATRAQVVFCDGKDLSWYGDRAIDGIDRLRDEVQLWRATRGA